MFLLVILFIAVPLVELYVIIQVGQWIGAGPTIALLLLDSILGAVLLRHQGRAAWRRFNLALSEGRVPHRETFDGAMVIFGGALPAHARLHHRRVRPAAAHPPTRAVIRGALTVIALRRFSMGQRVVFWTADRAAGERFRRRDYDVEGTAHEMPDEPGPGKGTGGTLPP